MGCISRDPVLTGRAGRVLNFEAVIAILRCSGVSKQNKTVYINVYRRSNDMNCRPHSLIAPTLPEVLIGLARSRLIALML